MATNPYFRHLQYNAESSLLDDLIVESIQQYGSDTYYLPREFQNEDIILGEDAISKFSKFYQMEMYIEVFDRFGGQGDFIQKFGIEIDDTATIVVSVRVFNQASEGEIAMPREGDLLFFPLNNQLFEITFVEDEPTFYQLGKQYMYTLKTKLFRYSDQEISTGIPEIDSYVDTLAYSMILTLGTGSGTFVVGEVAYQGTNLVSSTASAEILSYNTTTKKLEVKNVIGEFKTANGNVKGATSLAAWTLANSDTDYQNVFTNNSELETQAETLVTDSDSIFGRF